MVKPSFVFVIFNCWFLDVILMIINDHCGQSSVIVGDNH